ncbi:hypothetical protein [Bartonella doshiae]|uniref:hypothetical protein n=1 Tax=Bartonella doshiae TaxID=33044 RepID=UPI0009446C6E|nr:hypothetical protein [Bartonella doshiae]
MIILKPIGILAVTGFILFYILFFVITIALPYFSIKRVRLFFRMIRELPKSITQPESTKQSLKHCETKEQGVTGSTTSSLLSLRESFFIQPKEYKKIFFIFLIITVFMGAYHIINMLNLGNGGNFFIAMVLQFIVMCLLVSAPLIGVAAIIVTGKVKKKFQQLEEAIEQRDKALYSLKGNARLKHDGGKSDK